LNASQIDDFGLKWECALRSTGFANRVRTTWTAGFTGFTGSTICCTRFTGRFIGGTGNNRTNFPGIAFRSAGFTNRPGSSFDFAGFVLSHGDKTFDFKLVEL
jgi:hypothetical protein